MKSAETYATVPSASAVSMTRLSLAETPSRPVPTYGRSVDISGTPWRIMFAPMSARFASSCSRNGMRPAAIEITCIGATSMYCTSRAGLSQNSVLKRHVTRSSAKRRPAVSGAFACAMTYFSSSSAGRYSISSVTFPPTTLRYGVSMKPKRLICA